MILRLFLRFQTGEEVSSALKVTNEAITSEGSRAQSAESGLSSSISQNAEAITAEVTRATNAESSMSTLIQQNADNILLRVTKKDLSDEVASEVASEIEQSADTIRLKASKIVWQSDNSSMTEDGVLTATGANITGIITAEEGSIAGFTIKNNFLACNGDGSDADFLICPNGFLSSGQYYGLTISNDIMIEDVVFKISENFAIGMNGAVGAKAMSCEELAVKNVTLAKDGKIDFRGAEIDIADSRYVGWEETLKTTGITGTSNIVTDVSVGSSTLSSGDYDMADVMKYLLSGENVSCSFVSRISRMETMLGLNTNYISTGQTLENLYAAKTHSHSISDVTNLSSSLAGKANSSHTHSVSDISTLQQSLNSKADYTHTHLIEDIANLQSYLDAKAETSHTHDDYAKLSGATFSGTVQSTYFRAGDKYIEATSGATIGNSGYAAFGQTVTCKVLVQKSDRRLKNTIAELDHSFDEFFRKLKPVTFKFNDKKEFSFGFIAQDVQKALAESGHDIEQFDIVQKSKDVYYSINHAQITALNTHMIQIALNENAELKKRISQLEEKILELTA